MLYNFLFLYREVSHGHATGFCRTVSFKKENISTTNLGLSLRAKEVLLE